MSLLFGVCSPGPPPARPFGSGVLCWGDCRIADHQSGAAPLRVPLQLVRPSGQALDAARPSSQANAGLLRRARLSRGLQCKSLQTHTNSQIETFQRSGISVAVYCQVFSNFSVGLHFFRGVFLFHYHSFSHEFFTHQVESFKPKECPRDDLWPCPSEPSEPRLQGLPQAILPPNHPSHRVKKKRY